MKSQLISIIFLYFRCLSRHSAATTSSQPPSRLFLQSDRRRIPFRSLGPNITPAGKPVKQYRLSKLDRLSSHRLGTTIEKEQPSHRKSSRQQFGRDRSKLFRLKQRRRLWRLYKCNAQPNGHGSLFTTASNDRRATSKFNLYFPMFYCQIIS